MHTMIGKTCLLDLSVIHLVLVCFCCVELNQNEDQCVKLLLKLIDQLPAPNKSTLEVLMTHLCLYVLVYIVTIMHTNDTACKWLMLIGAFQQQLLTLLNMLFCPHLYVFCVSLSVAEFEKQTKMGTYNLAVVFGPSLIRPRPEDVM